MVSRVSGDGGGHPPPSPLATSCSIASIQLLPWPVIDRLMPEVGGVQLGIMATLR